MHRMRKEGPLVVSGMLVDHVDFFNNRVHLYLLVTCKVTKKEHALQL